MVWFYLLPKVFLVIFMSLYVAENGLILTENEVF